LNREDRRDLADSLVEIYKLITDVLQGQSTLPATFMAHYNGFLRWVSHLCIPSVLYTFRSLSDILDNVKDIARIGPIRAFLKSAAIKNEIAVHRQKLQDWKLNFTVCSFSPIMYVSLRRCTADHHCSNSTFHGATIASRNRISLGERWMCSTY